MTRNDCPYRIRKGLCYHHVVHLVRSVQKHEHYLKTIEVCTLRDKQQIVFIKIERCYMPKKRLYKGDIEYRKAKSWDIIVPFGQKERLSL